GGQYVPETLMPALAELERAWVDARADPAFRAELDGLLRDYCGRPTPLYRARRLSEEAGRAIYLKREDLLHTGAHKINNAIGEARAQVLEAEGRLPDRVIACVGGGSNSIGTFIPFADDEGVELVGVEAAGEGLDSGRHGAPLTAGGRPGVLHGSLSAIMQDEE